MINSLIIFGAEKLFLLSPLVALYFFYQLSREQKLRMAIFAFFSLPLTFILATLLRHVYFDPRPFVVGGFEPLVSHAPDNGFPSDHTLLLATIAIIWNFFRKKVALVLWIITLTVGFSRMAAGIHHFVDIVASIVIALIGGFVVHATIALWNKNNLENQNPINSSSL